MTPDELREWADMVLANNPHARTRDVARAVIALLATATEVTVREEWGARHPGDHEVWTEQQVGRDRWPHTEESARTWCRNLPGYTLVRRTRTVTPDVVSEWTEVTR